MKKLQPFEYVKDSEVNQCTEMSQDTSQAKEAATQKCQNSCSEKFQKIPKSIILFFAIKSTPPRVISWEFSRIFQNSCFKEHIRTAASEIIWGNRRDGFLFHTCSRPVIRIAVQKKFERSLRKKSVLMFFFLILTTKTLYDRQFPRNFFKYFRTAISRNSFGRLFLEGFLFHRSNSRKVLEKLLSKI